MSRSGLNNQQKHLNIRQQHSGSIKRRQPCRPGGITKYQYSIDQKQKEYYQANSDNGNKSLTHVITSNKQSLQSYQSESNLMFKQKKRNVATDNQIGCEHISGIPFEQINQNMKLDGITALKPYWEGTLEKDLRCLWYTKNADTLNSDEDLIYFIYLCELKLAKYNFGYRKQKMGSCLFFIQPQLQQSVLMAILSESNQKIKIPVCYQPKNNLFESMYQGLAELIKKFRVKMGLINFWQSFVIELQQYLRKKEDEKPKLLKALQQGFSSQDFFDKYLDGFESYLKNKLLKFPKQRLRTEQLLDHYITSKFISLPGDEYKYRCSNGNLAEIKDLIASEPAFNTGSSDWQDIFTLVQKITRNLDYTSVFSTQQQMQLNKMIQNQKTQEYDKTIERISWLTPKEKKRLKHAKRQHEYSKKSSTFFNNIDNQRLQSVNCLGCSKFFYKDMNIRDDSVNKVPVHVFPDINNHKRYQSQIRQMICSMLNSNGGVLLFSCIAVNLTIKVKGQLISELQKQKYENQISQLIEVFFPKVDIRKNIILTFVPVIDNPVGKLYGELCKYSGDEALIRGQEMYIKRPFLEGIYVARIVVRPSANNELYLWESIDGRVECSKLENNVIKIIKANNIAKHLKKKFKINPQYRQITTDCMKPEEGFKFIEEKIDQHKPKVNEKPEFYFNHMSMLKANKKYFPTIRSKLQKMGLKFYLEERFSQYNLPASIGTSVLFHKDPFSYILEIIQGKQFNFEGIQTSVVSIGDYLNLMTSGTKFPLSEKQRDLSLQFLNKEYPTDKIQYFSYEKQPKIQYFARTQTKLSTLLMYYYFKSTGQEVRFKGPKDFNSLPQEQKKRLLKKLFLDEEENKVNLEELKRLPLYQMP